MWRKDDCQQNYYKFTAATFTQTFFTVVVKEYKKFESNVFLIDVDVYNFKFDWDNNILNILSIGPNFIENDDDSSALTEYHLLLENYTSIYVFESLYTFYKMYNTIIN